MLKRQVSLSDLSDAVTSSRSGGKSTTRSRTTTTASEISYGPPRSRFHIDKVSSRALGKQFDALKLGIQTTISNGSSYSIPKMSRAQARELGLSVSCQRYEGEQDAVRHRKQYTTDVLDLEEQEKYVKKEIEQLEKKCEKLASYADDLQLAIDEQESMNAVNKSESTSESLNTFRAKRSISVNELLLQAENHKKNHSPSNQMNFACRGASLATMRRLFDRNLVLQSIKRNCKSKEKEMEKYKHLETKDDQTLANQLSQVTHELNQAENYYHQLTEKANQLRAVCHSAQQAHKYALCQLVYEQEHV